MAGLDLLQILAALRVPGRQDFFGLWSFARFIHENPAAGLYDPVRLNLYQHRLAPDFTTFYPVRLSAGHAAVALAVRDLALP